MKKIRRYEWKTEKLGGQKKLKESSDCVCRRCPVKK